MNKKKTRFQRQTLIIHKISVQMSLMRFVFLIQVHTYSYHDEKSSEVQHLGPGSFTTDGRQLSNVSIFFLVFPLNSRLYRGSSRHPES